MIGYLFKFDGPEASDPDEGSDDVSKDGTQQLKLLTRYALKADRYALLVNMICPLFRGGGTIIVIEVLRFFIWTCRVKCFSCTKYKWLCACEVSQVPLGKTFKKTVSRGTWLLWGRLPFKVLLIFAPPATFCDRPEREQVWFSQGFLQCQTQCQLKTHPKTHCLLWRLSILVEGMDLIVWKWFIEEK